MKALHQHFSWLLIMALLAGSLGFVGHSAKNNGKEIAVVVLGSIIALGAIAALTAESEPAADPQQ